MTVIIRKTMVYGACVLMLLLAFAAGGGYWLMRSPLPELDGEVKLYGLSAEVNVVTDRHGMPVISAANRPDAVRALGYMMARDRLFQMELMRRKMAGRLAEIFGDQALGNDIKMRIYGFDHEKYAVLAKLPPLYRQYLQSYAEGINSYVNNADQLPFEFNVLGFRPEPWTETDCVLIVFFMLEHLTADDERSERMLTVMEQAMPEDLVRFLTPDTDDYTEQLHQKTDALRPPQAIPVETMAAVLAGQSKNKTASAGVVNQSDLMFGSNAWAVGGSKTKDGRAIMANDMHLNISVPNIWYRAELRYGDTHAVGLILPGTPFMVGGSNEHVAWGNTNLVGDVFDLVQVETNPDNPDQYRVGDEWRPFDKLTETILVKDAEPKKIEVKQTVWGPVSDKSIMGKPVAIHWAALDPDAINFSLFEMEQSRSLNQAMDIMNRAGGPQLNMILADDKGGIAWTLTGSIPKRFGSDGSISRSWADGQVGWHGYIEPERLPRVVNPPEGFIVSANDRRLGNEYPYVVGHQFGNGYRAFRISRQLEQMTEIGEPAMLALQLDTESEFYRYYQQLALNCLTDEVLAAQPDLVELRRYLVAWDGRAEPESSGLAVLVEFRKQLIESVLTPFLSTAKQAEETFHYSWNYVDTPLQALLNERPTRILPDTDHYRTWDEFIVGQLRQALDRVQSRFPEQDLTALNWGEVNKVKQKHPFSKMVPQLGFLLDMPEAALPGCVFCVRAAGRLFGASERLVVSPGRLDDGILHLPGGQSGQPLSPYYRDQQEYWLGGLPLALTAGEPDHRLIMHPANGG